MTINFYEIPAGRRTPGRAFEINVREAAAGLIATGAPKVLAIGQRTSSGTIAKEVLKDIYSEDEGRTYFGPGSTLANLIGALFRQHSGVDLDAIALDDDAGGVAATGEFQLAGTATKAGVFKLWVGNRSLEIAVAVDDTAATLAAAIEATTDADYGDMPVTVAQDGVTPEYVDVTAKHKGPCGNDVYLGYELIGVEGITCTVVAMASGATYPDLDDALTVVEPEDYDIIVVGGFEDATELAKLETHLDAVGAPLEMRGGFGVYATRGTVAAATTLAANFATCFRLAPAICEACKTEPWELAGLYAGAIAAETNLARPLNNVELKGLDIPDASYRFTKTEQETLLWAGVGPISLGAANKMRIVRTVSTRTENAAGAPDDSMLDIQTLRVLEWLRDQLDAMFASKFPQEVFTDTLIDVARNEVIAVLQAGESIGYLDQVEDNLDGVVVERNETDQTQMDVRVPAPVVPGLHKIYGRVDYLKLSTAA